MKLFVYFRLAENFTTTTLRYKYMVYSTTVTNKRGQAYEFLHGHSSNVDRCFVIPKYPGSKSLPHSDQINA